jgi:CubicO group peptidase (beta-lactamase class C family)
MRTAFRGGALLLGVLLLASAAILGLNRRLISPVDLAPPPLDQSLSNIFPPAEGLKPSRLAATRHLADSLKSTAFIALQNGRLVAEWGATSKRISVHSVRKSLVSALYGIAVGRGLIDIDLTLADLGIDDHDPPLSTLEKQATLTHLLQARSGVYHLSVTDDNGPRPKRGEHEPGAEFFYNNWSFNALGGIFESLTGITLGDAFLEWIAEPTGMQDFRARDVVYTSGKESLFPAYRFWMSGRDLARFGQLYLQRGRWGDQQVIPESWIDESIARHTAFDDGSGYGYMWWILPDSSYLAVGTGDQRVYVDPGRDLVIVNRVDTGRGLGRRIWWFWGPRVDGREFGELVESAVGD